MEEWTKKSEDYQALPEGEISEDLAHCFEVFVDDFIGIAVPHTKEDLNHLSRALLHSIHDLFPASKSEPDQDPISLKKLRKGEGAWMVRKDILGWTFDGKNKTMELEEEKRSKLMATTKAALRAKHGVPFKDFNRMTGKMRHAAMGVPGSEGVFTPFNRVLARQPSHVWFRKGSDLTDALKAWRAISKEALKRPTHVKQLRPGDPEVGGVVDASKEGAGGVVFGITTACVPTVFRVEWPESIKAQLQTEDNPGGTITNSDLEMAGLVLLWLVIEHVVKDLRHKHVLMLSDNSPSVGWIDRMASKRSTPASKLLRALAYRINAKEACPLTPLHIPGVHNRIADIPSRSFGYKHAWHFRDDQKFLTFFNKTFPLPHQQSWAMCQLSSGIQSRCVRALATKESEMRVWQKLPEIGKSFGGTGKTSHGLWEWILTSSQSVSDGKKKQGPSSRSEASSGRAFVEMVNRSLAQLLEERSPQLERRSPWLVTERTHSR